MAAWAPTRFCVIGSPPTQPTRGPGGSYGTDGKHLASDKSPLGRGTEAVGLLFSKRLKQREPWRRNVPRHRGDGRFLFILDMAFLSGSPRYGHVF